MSDAALRALARRWREAGRAAVVVTVTRHRGSVPREAGTRMLVAADAVAGTVGGGQLEWQAIADARALLAGTQVAPFERDVALGPSLGQCCGGALSLRHTRLADDDPALWPLPAPRFVLHLFGAGHVGREVARILAGVPCRVRWVDERWNDESVFPADEPPLPHLERVATEAPAGEVAAAAPGDCYLVLTHSHAQDFEITRAILSRGDFGFFGLIGSATKRAKFEARLRERGVDAAQLARITCPIGLPGIAGKEPAVIAVAAVAQLLQHASAQRPGRRPGRTLPRGAGGRSD